MLESTQYAAIKLYSFVESFYRISRLGNTKDISYFFSDDKTLRSEYTRGLIFVFCFLMGGAALWFLFLIILRVLGKRVGCASGNAATIPAESMMSKGSFSVHTDETGEFIVMQADQNRVNRTRIFYFMSGLYTVFGCGFLLYGVIKLMQSLTSIYDAAVDVSNNVDTDKFEALRTAASEFAGVRDTLVTDLSGFCAGAPVVNGLNPADVTTAFQTSLSSVDDISINSAWDIINSDISDLDELIEAMVSFLGFINGPGTLWFILMVSVVSALAVFSIYMLVCAWKSGQEGYQFLGEDRPTCASKFLHFFATPFFALLLAAIWFSTSVVFTSQAANADLCYDEILTGETIMRMMVQRGYAETSDAYVLVDEYLHGCENKNATPNALMNLFDSSVEEAKVAAASFQDLTPGGDSTALEAACGGGTTDVLTKSNDAIDKLNTLEGDFSTVYDSMSCETMAPILQQAVYETNCGSLSVALLWSFISGLITATFGTIMLTLRSATQRPQIYIVAPNPAASDLDNDYSFG